MSATRSEESTPALRYPRAVFVVDRLPSSFKVDDREAPHPHEKAVRLIFVRAFAVRAAMGEAASHPGQEPFLDKTGEAKDSAHPKAIRLRSECIPRQTN